MSTTSGSRATPNNSVDIDMLDRITTANTIVVNKPEVFRREREKLNN
jgi:glutathione synthase/RimK-type ligase-like ATP-grasp enzyme